MYILTKINCGWAGDVKHRIHTYITEADQKWLLCCHQDISYIGKSTKTECNIAKRQQQ